MRPLAHTEPLFAHLEARRLLALIAYDGGPDGLGTDWNNPVNWAGDVLPGPNDQASLEAVGPGVVISANVSVQSIFAVRALTLAAGTLTVAQATSLQGRFAMTGGNLAGAANLTFAGGCDWSGGFIRTGGASGRITIPSGATMIVSGTDLKLLARGILNGGLLEIRSTNVFVDDENGAFINVAISNLAGGVVRFDGESYIDSTTLGTRTLTNNGRIEKTGTGQSGIGFTLTTPAAGRVEVLSGTFGLGLGSTAGTVNVADGALLAFNGHTMTGGSRLIGAGTAGTPQINGFTITGVVTVAGSFALNRADIFGSGTLRIEGALRTDGSILGCTNVTVAAGGELLFQGGNGSNVLSTRLMNQGTLRFGGSSVQVETQAGQNITNSAGGLMTFEGGNLTLFNTLNPGNLPLINNGQVQVMLGGGSISPRIDLTNSAGATMAITSGFFLEGPLVNHGSIALSGANANLTTSGALTGTGPITMSAGRIEIRGSASLATLQAINATGGEVRIRSTGIDLGGGTLTLAPGGQWTIRGGTVINGTINTTPGTPLLVGAFDGFTVVSTMRQITVNGDLALSDPNTVLNWQNVVVTGETVVSGNGAAISFDGTQAVSGTFRFPTTVGVHALRVRAGQTVTIEPNALLHGRFSIELEGVNPVGTLINRGIIRSNGGGGSPVSISGIGFRNEGRLEAIESAITVAQIQGDAGQLALSGPLSRISLTGTFTHSTTTEIGPGATLAFAGVWSNTGNVILSGGRWTLGGTFSRTALGTFTRTAPSNIDLAGALNLFGATLALNASTGGMTLTGGQFLNGTVALSEGAAITLSSNSSNRITNVRIEGDLELDQQGSTLRWSNSVVTGTVTLRTNGSVLAFDGTQTVTQGRFVTSPVSTLVSRTISISAGSTVTLAPGVVIESGGGLLIGGQALGSIGTRTLINQGTIRLAASLGGGQTPAIVPSMLVNQGTIEAVGLPINYNQVTFGNYTPGTFTLSGGTWIARDGGVVLPTPVNIRSLQANITLDGTNSTAGTLTQLNQLSGSLSLLGSKVQSITPAGGTFSSTGELTISAGSRLSVTGAVQVTVGVAGPGPITTFGLATGPAAGRLSATGAVTMFGRVNVIVADPLVQNSRHTLISGSSVVYHVSTTFAITSPPGMIRPVLEFSPTTLVLHARLAADYDNNNLLSPDDLDNFITDFYDPERRHLTDYNGDGVVNDLDLGAFIEAYFNR